MAKLIQHYTFWLELKKTWNCWHSLTLSLSATWPDMLCCSMIFQDVMTGKIEKEGCSLAICLLCYFGVNPAQVTYTNGSRRCSMWAVRFVMWVSDGWITLTHFIYLGLNWIDVEKPLDIGLCNMEWIGWQTRESYKFCRKPYDFIQV